MTDGARDMIADYERAGFAMRCLAHAMSNIGSTERLQEDIPQ